MSTTGFFRGHKIVWDEVKKEWFYDDDFKPIKGNIRPCKRCGKTFIGSGEGKPDPCIGNLPGVDNACCGHGEEGYIRFKNGVVIKGVFTIEYTPKHKKYNQL